MEAKHNLYLLTITHHMNDKDTRDVPDNVKNS